MATKDTNAKPEQAKPEDVHHPADRKKHRGIDRAANRSRS